VAWEDLSAEDRRALTAMPVDKIIMLRILTRSTRPAGAAIPFAPSHTKIPGKRLSGFGGVEQLSRYLDLMRRDTLLGSVRGILAAQLIKPQAKVLASDRGISCVTVDYDLLRGLDSADDRLF
jgi:hypothetical protein